MNSEIQEIKKEIVIERLRQAPQNIKISFGMSEGNFLNRDKLIDEVKKDTLLGRQIINIHLEYLKAFKKNIPD